MRQTLRTVGLPAGLTALAFAVLYAPSTVVGDEVPDWLPSVGPHEFTLTLYLQIGTVLGTAAVLAGALALGYREARHRDVTGVYRRYAGAVLLGGAGALVLTVVTLIAAGETMGTGPFGLVLPIAVELVAVPGVFAVSALAGVALASLPRPGPADAPSIRTLLPLGAAAALVCGLGVALESAFSVLVSVTGVDGLPAFLPRSWSLGSTFVTYIQLTRLASDLALLGGGLALGYLAVRRLGVETLSRQFVAVVAVGGFAGFWLAWLPTTAIVVVDGVGTTLGTYLLAVPASLLSTVAVATLAAVAGVGVARFEGDGRGAVGRDGTGATGRDGADATAVDHDADPR
ncbi:hypothetical protein HZS55_00065 [Halosimplex rubrum]|uniref:Uncharacterized protein n=1 Tax=Halosimplex rubrum TaxID=869889 RepID=A0A7D5T394_9EURY|nr:hypothetical protein [Halosimplex rubrum]QLH75793.1 hypothetical protein HZS55_00065 [Halosimplex rubrum]